MVLLFSQFSDVRLSSATTQQSKHLKEDHDDVEIEDEGSNDVVVNGQLILATTDDKLSVDEQEEAIDDDTEAGSEGNPSIRVSKDEHGKDTHQH